jgi:hypothetical protein
MNAPAKTPRPRLPRRDLVLLPLISLLTIAFLFVASEATARYFFSASEKDVCEVDDAKIGFKFRPNCTSRMKTAEGPWVVNHYNECGYRTNESCGPKPAGSLRISLIGSSASEGLLVSYEDTFANRTARELTEVCGRPVEVQNLGRKMCSPACTFHRVDEALALKPDLLVMTVTPHDLETLLPSEVADRYKPIPPLHSGVAVEDKQSALKRAQVMLTGSRTVTAIEHYLFQDPSTYLKMYLVYGDKADFLRQPFSPEWQERLNNMDLLLGEMAQKARAANVPFVLIEMPSLAQASIVSLQNQPPKVDAEALNRRLRQISEKYGVVFVDPLDEFKKTPGSNKMFYMVDGHIDGQGQALISAPLVEELTEGKSPVLAGCSSRQTRTSSVNQ